MTEPKKPWKEVRFANAPWAQYSFGPPQETLQGVPPIKQTSPKSFQFLVDEYGNPPDWPVELIRESQVVRSDVDGVGVPTKIDATRFDMSGDPPAFEYDSSRDQFSQVEKPPYQTWFDPTSVQQQDPRGQFLARLMDEEMHLAPSKDERIPNPDYDKIMGPKMTPQSWSSIEEFNEAMLSPQQLKSKKKSDAQMKLMQQSIEKRLKKRGYTQEKPLPK